MQQVQGEAPGAWRIVARAALTLALAALAGSRPLPTHAAPPAPPEAAPAQLTLLGQTGGQTTGAVVRGAFAYLGVGPRVVVLDVADPARPRQVGQSAILPAPVAQLAAGPGATLLVTYATGYPYTGSGFAVFDASNPAQPAERGSLALDVPTYGLVARGGLAYVAAGDAVTPGGRLLTVDVADPAQPRLAGSLALPGEGFSRLALDGDRLYGLDGGTLLVVSLADPARPAVAALVAPPKSTPYTVPTTAILRGNVAYVAGCVPEEHGPPLAGLVQTVDLGDLAKPRLLGSATSLGCVEQLFLGGGVLTTTSDAGLAGIDARDPTRLTTLGTLRVPGGLVGLALAGSRLYTAGGESGELTIFDVADPAKPAVLGAFPLPSHVGAPTVAGRYGYVAADDKALLVLDVADPANPVPVGQVSLQGGVSGIVVAGAYAYVAEQGFVADGANVPGAIVVLDVRDPRQPRIVSMVRTAGAPMALASAGPWLYVTEGLGATSPGAGLHVFDIANPARPVEAAFLALPGASEHVAVAGGVVGVLTEGNYTGRQTGLAVVSVADPRHPALAAFVRLPDVWSIAAARQVLYVVSDYQATAFDVADPAQPRQVGAYPLAWFAGLAVVSGQNLYVGGGPYLTVIDLADPAHPVHAAKLPRDEIGSLAVVGDRVYAATFLHGLWIYRYDGPAQAPPPLRHDARYFPQTGYRIDEDAFWDEFTRRGGVQTFGYPISRTFTLRGYQTQLFQRQVMTEWPDGTVQLLNLLDPGYMPYTSFDFATIPPPDPALTRGAPSPTHPDYASGILPFVRQHAPDAWQGLPVAFYQTFSHLVSAQDAFPNGDGNLALLPLFSLEVLGVPTSAPAYDPKNHQFVYLRFQRGVLQYDAACGCTRAVLFGAYFKAILTGERLPADLAAEARGSAWLRQYDPTKPLWVRDPTTLEDTDMTYTFTPG